MWFCANKYNTIQMHSQLGYSFRILIHHHFFYTMVLTFANPLVYET